MSEITAGSDLSAVTPLPGGPVAAVNLATMCAEFAAVLGASGISVPVQRVCWWAEAVIAAAPSCVDELYWLARVTLLDRPEHLGIFDAVFREVFRGPVDMADFRGDPANSLTATKPGTPGGAGDDEPSGDDEPPTVLAVASEVELLRDKDFADCDADELAELAKIIARMRVVAPVRPSRWEPSRRSGQTVDLRRTLRAACRTGGDPIRWSRRRRSATPRKIVLLADVSGSMHAYSRVYLRVLQGAVIGARAQAYVFATRLHPVTRALGRGRRQDAISRAMALSPDASGGTRIGGAVKDFLDTDGRRGLARGAVVVIVSDGWERADPALLGEQMGRLTRLAHRVIWVNPRKAAPGFAPLTGGMAAALPHVDTFVSGHSARSVAELLEAIAGS